MKRLVLCVAVLMAVVVDMGESQGAIFKGLGHLPGTVLYPGAEIGSFPLGVSADGSVVVGRNSSNFPGPNRAFRWTEVEGMTPLPSEGSAFAASDDGSVVVGDFMEPFRWTEATGVIRLGGVPGGSEFGKALSVSADGSVVVGYSYLGSTQKAFRWTEADGMVGLGDPSGEYYYSSAHGVSADGSVVVGIGVSTIGGQAFRWTEATGIIGLGDLPGGSFRSMAYDISADGSTIVGQAQTDLGPQAFRWTEATGMVDLGTVYPGSVHSRATAVSADGSVIVGSGPNQEPGAPFIWTEKDGMRDLRYVLRDDYGLDLSGWNLMRGVVGISDDGNTIVGEGWHIDHVEAWMVTGLNEGVIPEPSSIIVWSLIVLTFGGVGSRRRKA